MKSELKSQKVSSENIGLLMENIWLRHKVGLKQSRNNVFLVELPPPSPEELVKSRKSTKPKKLIKPKKLAKSHGEYLNDELDEEASMYCVIV